MANLDNLQEIQRLDSENILKNIQEFPAQCERAWNDFKKFPIPTGFIQAKSVLLCGMGGSGISGALVAGMAETADIPVLTWSDYNIPGWVNKDTLVIINSYSGNTEETITSYKKAAEKTNKIITISTGGKIASLSTNYRHPHYKIDYGSEPRAAIGFSLMAILAILAKYKIIEITDEEFHEALILLKGLQKKNDLHVPLGTNNAKLLAEKLSGRIPIIFSSGILTEVARRWKSQFNENAKTASYYEVIPEMNHNALVGLEFPENLRSKIFILILQSKFDHPRNRLRQSITSQILDHQRLPYEFVMIEPAPTPLASVLQTIHFGDYVSFYLAIVNGVNPTTIESVIYLKEKLDEKPLETKS